MVSRDELSRRFLAEGIIVSSPAFERIIERGVDAESIIASAKEGSVWLLTDEFLSAFLSSEGEITRVASDISGEQAEKPVEVVKSREIYAKEVSSDLKFFEDFDVSGKSTCQGELDDFVAYFGDRFKNGASILRQRMEYRTPVAIERMKSEGRREQAGIICMV